jgi:hypothetical protein
MKTLFIAVGALAIATPALAQTSGNAASAPMSQTPPASDPMTSGQSSPEAAPAAPGPAAPADPKAIIAAEFPTYDKDNSGGLNATEFGTWLTALKEKSGGAAMKPSEKSTWLKGAFTTADADKDKAVSQAELATYLTAGA